MSVIGYYGKQSLQSPNLQVIDPSLAATLS